MKKTFAVIGMIVCAGLVLLGICVKSGSLGGKTQTASEAPYRFDSGYATFGGDFYTYAANNAEEAASASRTVAQNLDEIAKLLKNTIGLSLICFGAIGFCGFGVVISGCTKDEAKEMPIEEADETEKPVSDTEAEASESESV